ncbi:MurR/RpiR family transcriptional regulator [Oceanicola sp. S124]|uniref:MurR/RpiR family transcriptional regulator n=1 Tax=Oceanicola sp. S124 TaxID=1042378 RepID=UPI0002559376|nr:MurR/RpiR family transcriptional regulator [Oceanicola sp. S124]
MAGDRSDGSCKASDEGGALSVRQRIRLRDQQLTAAERRVCDVLLDDYPMAGMQSVTKLAELACVSTPTVIRMARKLGFEGFPELQNALRDEVADRIKAPALKRDARGGDGHVLHRFADALIGNLTRSLERLDTATFDEVAELLADTSRHAYFLGGRITGATAAYFHNHMQIIRTGVTLLDQGPSVWPHYLLDMGESSVLVLFDIRRYEKDLLRLAELAQGRGATIVLFTDQWGSPIAQVARHVFHLQVEAPSNWDSTTAIVAVVEALIAEVQAKRWDESRERLDELEAMFSTTRVFRSGG